MGTPFMSDKLQFVDTLSLFNGATNWSLSDMKVFTPGSFAFASLPIY